MSFKGGWAVGNRITIRELKCRNSQINFNRRNCRFIKYRNLTIRQFPNFFEIQNERFGEISFKFATIYP